MNEHLFQYFDELESTNLTAKKLLSEGRALEGMMVQTAFQTVGKGQLNAVWESRKGKNLLLSVILFPKFLPLEKQYYLNRIAALAVTDFLCLKITDTIQIKWPNDVLVNGEKISGILIENSIQGNNIENCVIGVGINLNQTKFGNYIPAATSLYNLTYSEFDLKQCAHLFYKCLMNRYKQLSNGLYKILTNDFNKLLYGKGELLKYRVKGEMLKATILEVKDTGELVLKDKTGKILEFRNKELEYLYS